MLDGERMRTWAALALALLVAITAFRLFGDRGGGPDAGAAPRVAVGGASGAQGSGARVFVHVAGEVRRPGLYKLRAHARVGDAVRRAGGPSRRADLGGVNLAAPVEDGRQVLVPRRGAAAAAAAAPAGADGPGVAGATQVSLGSATLEQLDAIDGIGPTLAQRIVEYREAHGGFRSLDELREVEGIGEKRFESLSAALQP